MSKSRIEPREPDARSSTFSGLQPIPRADLGRIAGGRCWDGPLGDGDECPPKPVAGRAVVLTSLYDSIS